jgi:hypothetical protein
MTPLEKIELLSMRVHPPPRQCNTAKMKVRKQRDEFVKNILLNVMVDGLAIICKK